MRTRKGPTLEHLSAILTEASEPILTTLDNIVRQYVAESDVRIEKLQSSQQITLIIVILTLTAEALFIFRPLASGILAAVERMKELSRRATDAQRASAAKSSFLAHISHELRTPMTGIIGMTDLLLNSPQSPEQEKMTRLLRQSAQNLHDLLNDILDLAKIEVGSITLESVDFSLSDLLTSVRELFAHTMQAKGLAFVFETPETPIDVFRGNPKHLRQVLYNLVSNALKFTNAGYVRVKCWQENADAGQATLKFSVTDSGIGISQDNIERLFGKFEQEDSSTAHRFGGAGLGLAICKQLTEAMGGGIEVHSTKGSGSVFTFSVRVKRGDPVGQNTAGASLQAGRDPENPNLNILVVDDNPTTQFLIREVLAFWGHAVTSADSGHEAFERILVDNFDVILLDMQMPELNGEQTARLIRAIGGTSATTPIIAVTADAVVANHKRYFAAGCSSVVTKPISWDHLAKEIQGLGGKTAKARAAATVVVATSVA